MNPLLKLCGIKAELQYALTKQEAGDNDGAWDAVRESTERLEELVDNRPQPGLEPTEGQVLIPVAGKGWQCPEHNGFWAARGDWTYIVARALEYIKRYQLAAAIIQLKVEGVGFTMSEYVDTSTSFKELMLAFDKQIEDNKSRPLPKL